MNEFLCLFLIIAIGLLIGKIRIANITLGLSAIMLVALVFGHYEFTLPPVIKSFGLILFLSAIGIMSGPTFFDDFKKGAMKYMATGTSMIFASAIICLFAIKLINIPLSLSLGLLAGALSSTPCLATSLEITGDSLVSVGYGISYPFGVVGVVLLVQFISKLGLEGVKIKEKTTKCILTKSKPVFIDKNSIFLLAGSACLGIILSKIRIPIMNGFSFSVGVSGGSLFSALLIGFIVDRRFTINKQSIEVFRDLGLVLFLAGSGVEAGSGFIKTIQEYGAVLLIIGIVITISAILLGFCVSRYVLKMDKNKILGLICGGMTSTPALGSLSELDDYDTIANAYAATYSFSIFAIMIVVQIIVFLS